MLIFTLPSWYKSKKYPEGSIFIYEQMQALRKLGHKVVVLSVQLCPVQSLRKASSEIDSYDDNGIITYETEINVIQPSRFREIYVKSFRRALDKMIVVAMKEHGKPDVFYAHFTFAAGYAAIELSEKYRVPLVVEEHYSGLMNGKIDRRLKEYLKDTVEKSEKFICVSEGLKNAVDSKIGDKKKISVISNMINPCFVYMKPKQHDNFIFFSCGSLIPRKGFDLLIEAFSEEFGDEDNVKLRIGGQGSEKEKLQKLIRENDAEGKISLIGQLTRQQTLTEYDNCNCFVLVSKAETYGLVYREALAVGRPVISTKHGGFGTSDWYDDYGFLVDVDNKSQLRVSLRRMYCEYNSYSNKRISELCLADCSENAVAEKIEKLLDRATETYDEEKVTLC